MVMQIKPVDRAITALKAARDYDEVIYTSPDGKMFDQPMANRLSLLQNIIILCGHYKGIDFRIREHLITLEISRGLICPSWRAACRQTQIRMQTLGAGASCGRGR